MGFLLHFLAHPHTRGANLAWQRSKQKPKFKENIITTMLIFSLTSGFPQTRACFLMERKSANWLESASGKKDVKMKKTFPHSVTHSGQCENDCLCAQIPQYTHKTHIRSRWGKQLGIPYGWSQSQHLFPLSKSTLSSLNILCESASSSTNTPSPPHTGTRGTC